jgi:hypothetical protein
LESDGTGGFGLVDLVVAPLALARDRDRAGAAFGAIR